MKRISIVIVVLVAICIAGLVYYVKSHSPKYNWYPEYTKQSQQPYGLKYFYDLLNEQGQTLAAVNSQVLYNLDSTSTNSNFISVNTYIDLDSNNASLLLGYIYKGNNALIITEEAPLSLLANLVPFTDSIYGFDQYEYRTVDIRFDSVYKLQPEKLTFQHKYAKEIKPVNWYGYSKNYFDSVLVNFRFIPISYLNDSIVNCFYIKHGKGLLIVHSSPLLYTNYNLFQKHGFYNTSNVLSYLNKGPLYWNESNYDFYMNNMNGNSNPLNFLFSHYTLKVGWYLLLVTIILYLLFRSKREQRIIPVVYKNKNTSIEFSKAVGSLYYQKKLHHNIANELYNVFLFDLRAKYNISTTLSEPEVIQQLVKRTGVNQEFYENLFKQFKDTKNSMFTTAKDLTKLYKSLEIFYNQKK